MNTAVMFGKATDEWSTPQAFFDALDAEFHFTLDAAARRENAKCDVYFGPDMLPPFHDALTEDWWLGHQPDREAVWLNPPYSRCGVFLAKAADEARNGLTVVALVPARTDTRWWFAYVWDAKKHLPRPGVEVRFIKGRLKFGDGKNSAPFPSVVIIFKEPA
jgi:site-specific DNA-methyltransferase (adenine-specific)